LAKLVILANETITLLNPSSFLHHSFITNNFCVDKKKAVKTALFEFLFEINGDYIRIHSTPTLTYLRTSLQTSLQNQTKREGYEKDDFI